jgi:hypothetical protein
MNNQLKLPWVQTYRETPTISRPAFLTVIQETIQKVGRQLRRTGQVHHQPELGRGYSEFVSRRHSLR